MVRLVFRPYTQVRRTICTSVSLRASTRVSSGFALLRHSSPSFGSQHVCSHSNLSQKIIVWSFLNSQVTCASWVCHPPTRTHVRLLGPCFKTGRSEPFCQHRRRAENFNQRIQSQPALLVVPEMVHTESQSIA